MVSLFWIAILLTEASAQQRVPAPAAPMGTYLLRRSRDAGCWLEVGPVARDTVRVQLQCERGAASFNMGFLDERFVVRGSTVTYGTREFADECHITMRFRGSSAKVKQVGSCGFGGSVSADGTYRRTSRRKPPFDLDPNR